MSIGRFPCPRCATVVEERFYGPCRSCRSELVGAIVGAEREIARPEFEPRANVVANHVATKD